MALGLNEFIPYIEAQRAKLLSEPSIRRFFESTASSAKLRTDGDPAEAAFGKMLFDALATLRLIEDYSFVGARLLEIGGGVGFNYLWLKHLGFDAYSIEPSSLGDSAYEAGIQIMRKLGVDPGGWLPIMAHEVPGIGRRFDVIFSNNVLEHIDNLDEATAALASVLSKNGVMRHNCPNYQVPYEPHFGIPLIPGAPRKTAVLSKRLGSDPLWKTINFVTSRRMRKLARENRLEIQFDREHLLNTFLRLGDEPEFREKHPAIYGSYRVLKSTRLLGLLAYVPPSLVTPIQFTLRRKEREAAAI